MRGQLNKVILAIILERETVTANLRAAVGFLKIPANMGALLWDYSGIGILGMDGIYVLLGAIPFSE